MVFISWCRIIFKEDRCFPSYGIEVKMMRYYWWLNKIAVTPVLMHWSYHSLVLSHQIMWLIFAMHQCGLPFYHGIYDLEVNGIDDMILCSIDFWVSIVTGLVLGTGDLWLIWHCTSHSWLSCQQLSVPIISGDISTFVCVFVMLAIWVRVKHDIMFQWFCLFIMLAILGEAHQCYNHVAFILVHWYNYVAFILVHRAGNIRWLSWQIWHLSFDI